MTKMQGTAETQTTQSADSEVLRSLKQHFSGLFAQHGTDVRALGWADADSQRLRFKVLSEIGDLGGKRILDVGCGFGDFAGFLREKGIEVQYTGLDVCPELISVAKERHPDLDFRVGNVLESFRDEDFDYVFLSGALNYSAVTTEFAKRVLRRVFELCRIGVAANMVSTYVDFRAPDVAYFSPEDIFSFCMSLSPYVTLRHDYPLYEFAVYVWKKVQPRHKR